MFLGFDQDSQGTCDFETVESSDPSPCFFIDCDGRNTMMDSSMYDAGFSEIQLTQQCRRQAILLLSDRHKILDAVEGKSLWVANATSFDFQQDFIWNQDAVI